MPRGSLMPAHMDHQNSGTRLVSGAMFSSTCRIRTLHTDPEKRLSRALEGFQLAKYLKGGQASQRIYEVSYRAL